jgi:hypothetical protein
MSPYAGLLKKISFGHRWPAVNRKEWEEINI